MSLAQRWLLRNALCSLGVLAVVAGAGYGLPAVDRELPDRRPVPAARPYRVGGEVSVTPPPGALLDLTATRRRADGGSAVFVAGGLRYGVVVAPASAQLPGVERRLAMRLRTVGFRVGPTGVTVATLDGRGGLAGEFSQRLRAGRYAVFVLRGREVQITVVGPPEALGRARVAVEDVIASIRGPA
jgi:hypothetical protein